MKSEYSLLILYFSICLIFICILYFSSIFFVYQRPLLDKISSYECGFNSFFDARSQFDVRFYIVGLLFLISDLELIFLFPWVIVFWQLTFVGFFSMLVFLLILVLGFVYEIQQGCLNWK